mgnify:CR=1 FL=1
MVNVKKKIVFILASRGNYAKLKNLILLCSESKKFNVHVVVSGQLVLDKYSKIILKDLKKSFTYHHEIYFQVEGENNLTMLKSCSLAMTEVSSIFYKIKPDLVVVLADRFETLAFAAAASFLNIKLAHLEGGEESGSIDNKIRHAVTMMSDIHFPCTQKSEKFIIKMIGKQTNVYNVGCTSFDEIKKLNINNIDFFETFKSSHGVGANIKLEKKKYVIFALHPVTTNYSENETNINECLIALTKINIPIIFLWPNIDAGSDLISKAIRQFREKNTNKNIFFVKSISIEYFAPLLNNCSCIIGNSSTGLRESSFLGIPSVNIGERQLNRERASNVLDINFDYKKILKAVKIQLKKKYKPSSLYGSGDSSKKIVKFLIKYFENEKI